MYVISRVFKGLRKNYVSANVIIIAEEFDLKYNQFLFSEGV